MPLIVPPVVLMRTCETVALEIAFGEHVGSDLYTYLDPISSSFNREDSGRKPRARRLNGIATNHKMIVFQYGQMSYIQYTPEN